MAFIRKVKTSSGATAVQIAYKEYGRIIKIEHIGSAHNEADLSTLLSLAKERTLGRQLSLLPGAPEPLGVRLKRSYSRLLHDSLMGIYSELGFNELSDETFAALCIARLVEPTSKLDSIRVLEGLGISPPSNTSIHRCLKRIIKDKYQDKLSKLCFAYASRGRGISLVLYDVTTLYFEAQKEDEDIDTGYGTSPGFRKSGMSKERRLDPQIVVGLLVDQNGFPLELHSFEGDKAETKTIVPVIDAFKARHGLVGLTVVADAGMLSADNLSQLALAGYTYIVGSRMSKIPYDIAEYQKSADLADGQIVTSSTKVVGQRVIYQYRTKRAALDLRNIGKQIEKAERIISGKSAQKKAKFLQVKTEGKFTSLNQDLVAKAKALAGIKGYVTNLPETDHEASNAHVISHYHQLWRVEQSFRMSKSDLKARPIFHHTKQAIEAHLTVVLAALAVTRYIEQKAGISLKKLVNLLQPIRNGTVTINGHEYQAEPEIPKAVEELLEKLGVGH